MLFKREKTNQRLAFLYASIIKRKLLTRLLLWLINDLTFKTILLYYYKYNLIQQEVLWITTFKD